MVAVGEEMMQCIFFTKVAIFIYGVCLLKKVIDQL